MVENKQGDKGDEKNPHPETHVMVEIVTTSGTWPDEGFDKVPAHQKIQVLLEKAVKKLRIADVNGWIATVGDKELNVDSSYLDNGLTGRVSIDYGPREGGGGCARSCI